MFNVVKGMALAMKGCGFVFAVIMMLVSQDAASAEAIEIMRTTFDRYKIEVVTQTPNGTESLSANLWYVDAGEGAESLVTRAVKDFFDRNGLQLSDYYLAWQERTFEGLVENEDGLLIKQYRAKAIYRRKDTAAPLPLEKTDSKEEYHEEEYHEVIPKKEFNIAGLALIVCLWGSYVDWVYSEDAARLRKLMGKRIPLVPWVHIQCKAIKRRAAWKKRKKNERKETKEDE